MLPERLVMFVAKELGKYLFNKVLKELKNWDKTVWAKEMKDNYQENAFFYDWISKKMESWLLEITQTQWLFNITWYHRITLSDSINK